MKRVVACLVEDELLDVVVGLNGQALGVALGDHDLADARASQQRIARDRAIVTMVLPPAIRSPSTVPSM